MILLAGAPVASCRAALGVGRAGITSRQAIAGRIARAITVAAVRQIVAIVVLAIGAVSFGQRGHATILGARARVFTRPRITRPVTARVGAGRITAAIRVGAIRQAVTIVIPPVDAHRFRCRCGAAVIRATARILACITDTVTTERCCPAIDLTVRVILTALADRITAARRHGRDIRTGKSLE